MRAAPPVAVIGEALIDLVEADDDAPRLARPGGSPYNVAIGLARLERAAAFVGRLSHDPLGTVLRNHALRSGVDLSLCVEAHEPSTVALVELAEDGSAQYRFGVDGTADFRWTDAELAAVAADAAGVHFGSLASWLAPGDRAIARRVALLRDAGVTVSYDPNVRPHLQHDRADARRSVEAGVRLAHLVKTSDEDLAYLYPGEPLAEVARRWLTGDTAPSVVVVTRGGDGVSAFTARDTLARPPAPSDVVDTVGAGDAFTAGLLDALLERALFTPAALAAVQPAALADVLDHASLVAAITCSRAGANPPRRRELFGAAAG
ncbi:carbohydrate kinase [uncultured Jatrophihabitans sp.]|uniref:carbohydrate kinase family protein n=1 Tax=uncultured Jatrophihabitans sp. TaxID=1610747 RepID=UPI0035C95540